MSLRGTAPASPEDAWDAVMALARAPGAASVRARLDSDPARFARFLHRGAGIALDLSRTALTEASLAALLGFARARGVTGFRDAMARGDAVNVTERRAALHMALRAPPGSFRAGEEDASAEVHATLSAMRDFARAVHSGAQRGATGERFTDVVNIGIGGSDLGPAMVTRALWRAGMPLRAHYLANVDAHAWEAMRAGLDPRRAAGGQCESERAHSDAPDRERPGASADGVRDQMWTTGQVRVRVMPTRFCTLETTSLPSSSTLRASARTITS